MSAGATGVTRLTIFAGTTSTAARRSGIRCRRHGRAGAGGGCGSHTGRRSAAARAAGSGTASASGSGIAGFDGAAGEGIVGRRELSVGGALIGALSGMVGWRRRVAHGRAIGARGGLEVLVAALRVELLRSGARDAALGSARRGARSADAASPPLATGRRGRGSGRILRRVLRRELREFGGAIDRLPAGTRGADDRAVLRDQFRQFACRAVSKSLFMIAFSMSISISVRLSVTFCCSAICWTCVAMAASRARAAGS